METKYYVGKKMKEFRKSKRLGQKQIAKIIDVKVACVSHYEVGRLEIGIGKLMQLCDFFDIDISYFLPPKKKPSGGEIVIQKEAPRPST